jgi:hypothetical protein
VGKGAKGRGYSEEQLRLERAKETLGTAGGGWIKKGEMTWQFPRERNTASLLFTSPHACMYVCLMYGHV